jgi:peptide/nickel transport system permease protein
VSASELTPRAEPGMLASLQARAVGVWRRLLRSTVSLIGFVIVGIVALAALFAPLIAPHGPLAGNPEATLQGPSWHHLFGTDATGFDIFSRVLYGARVDLGIALGAVALALIAGSILGALAGYMGRLLDELIMRTMDVLSAFPTFILAMGIVAALGPSVVNLIVAIGLVNVPVYARLLRANVLSIRERQFVMAARAVGNTRLRILFKHILPNAIAPIFVQATLQAGYAILEAAGLSFIGLGVAVPNAEWGVMINLGLQYIVSGQWWITFFPGIAIAITVMGFNLIGDGLQEVLDPRKR